MKINIASVQMCSTRDLQQNLKKALELSRHAMDQGAELIVLPEMFALFGERNALPLANNEVEFTGEVGTALREFARTYQTWLVAGTVPVAVEGEDRPRARCHVLDSQGEVVSYYDKIHLFDADIGDAQQSYRESDSYAPGGTPVVVDSPWGKIGLAVCYDLRFPELFRELNDRGAQAVIVPSAFTHKTGEAHWEVLCRARAIENGYFVVGTNQCGHHSEKRQTWGHSMHVSPWGEFESLGSKEGVLVTELAMSEVELVRAKVPVNKNRRL